MKIDLEYISTPFPACMWLQLKMSAYKSLYHFWRWSDCSTREASSIICLSCECLDHFKPNKNYLQEILPHSLGMNMCCHFPLWLHISNNANSEHKIFSICLKSYISSFMYSLLKIPPLIHPKSRYCCFISNWCASVFEILLHSNLTS